VEAIGQLGGLERAWRLRVQLESFIRRNPFLMHRQESLRQQLRLEAAVQLPRWASTVDDAQWRWLEMLDDYRGALRLALPGVRSPDEELDRRLTDFYRMVGSALARVAAERLAELMVAIDDGLTRGRGHFESLYRRLGTVVSRGGSTPEPIAAVQPELDHLTRDYPILGIPKLAEKAIRDYRRFSAPNWDLTSSERERGFAGTTFSDLTRWRERTLRVQKRLHKEPRKAWLADRLVQYVLTSEGRLPDDHFLREVAARNAQDVEDDRSLLDLGAGTGKLTATLVELGVEVVAVEPDPAMLAELRRALPVVRAVGGSAEAIPVPAGSVDVVLAGNALHWFDMAVAGPEIARVLTPGGVLAGLWNVLDDRVSWVEGLVRISGGAAVGPRDTVSTWRAATAGLHRRAGLVSWFGPPQQAEFRHGQRRTADSLVATLATRAGCWSCRSPNERTPSTGSAPFSPTGRTPATASSHFLC
jgi:SAM-dependent methyltransferase